MIIVCSSILTSDINYGQIFFYSKGRSTGHKTCHFSGTFICVLLENQKIGKFLLEEDSSVTPSSCSPRETHGIINDAHYHHDHSYLRHGKLKNEIKYKNFPIFIYTNPNI